jgi:Histidine kinase-, DNA gyrase B-, and HSP90-like ATPase
MAVNRIPNRLTNASGATPGDPSRAGSPSDLHFDVSTGLKRVLGRELITNEEVAIFEMVKNSFDAKARTVYLHFEQDSITIADDGSGSILLYPAVDIELDAHFEVLGFPITVRTLNRAQPWHAIHSDLIHLILN